MKVTVTEIKHIEWAKRLIIKFFVPEPPFDPSKGGWIYLLPRCGYRGVCDDDWIIMDPNWQHPLHSDNISAPGENTFVWDYGGVHGLDPKAFDAEHSYVVQIACIDSSCDWVDPCADTGWTTPDTAPIPGITPEGEVGTEGNCGPGYVIEQDLLGCLKCTEDNGTPPGGSDPQPTTGVGGVFTKPWVYDGPTTPPVPGGGGVDPRPRPTSPPIPGGPLVDGPYSVPTAGGGDGQPPDPPVPPNPPKPTSAGDKPSDATPWTPPPPGPGRPENPGGDDTGGTTETPTSGGLIDGGRLVDPYFDGSLGGVVTTDDTTYAGEGWVGHDQGGREASFDNRTTASDGMNAELPLEMTFYTAGAYIVEPSKNLAMDINPKNVPSDRKDSINENLGVTKASRNTRIEDAVSLNDLGSSALKGRDGDATDSIIGKGTQNSTTNRAERTNPDFKDFTRSPRLRASAAKPNSLRLRGTAVPSPRRAVGNRNRGEQEQRVAPRVRNTGHVVAFKDNTEFLGNYVLKLVASPINNGMVFIDSRVDIKPKSARKIRLRVYLVQNKKSRLVAETGLQNRAYPRVISTTVSAENMIPGKEITVMAVVDDGTNIIGRAANTFILTDYGSAQAGGSYVPQGRGAYKSAIETMVQPREKKSIVVGSEPERLVVQTIGSHDTEIELAAYSTVFTQDVQQSMAIYNLEAAQTLGIPALNIKYLGFSEDALVKNTGPLNVNGLSLRGNKYAGGVWGEVAATGVSGTGEFMLVVSNTDGAPNTRTELYIGKHLQFKPMAVTGTTFAGTGGTYSVDFETPYADSKLGVYEAGGNYIVPEDATEKVFTTDLSGNATVSVDLYSLPTWFAVAKQGDGTLAERTITWFQAKP